MASPLLNPGLIVDRDGTLTYERGYLSSPAEVVPLPGVEMALRKAKRAGVKIIVVTNQSAVARGIVTELGLHRIHDHLTRQLGLDAVYHCPHLPDAGCACRKPLPALVERAVADFRLDRRQSLLVGDHPSDCQAARAAGIDAALVRTGHGAEHVKEAEAEGFRVVADLPEAVDIFLARLHPFRRPPPSEIRARR